MPQIEFLCGCITGNVISRENLITMDAITTDEEDMLVCAIHKERRKNYRSIPWYQTSEGLFEETWLLGYSLSEIEGFVLFDEIPRLRLPEFNFNSEDKRDNRDPEKLGKQILHNNID